MKVYDAKLVNLAKKLNKPLYIVGGYVRNYYVCGAPSSDVDLCAPFSSDYLLPYLEQTGYRIVAHYKRTKTVVFSDGENRYEFTSFRKEKYIGGTHTPEQTEFTEDILEDAKRRDFKCNAIYYDIAAQKTVDLLGGTEDVKNKILNTVTDPERVFMHDGLRLMRLARFVGELGFRPSEETLSAAKKYAFNIKDISAERIYDELKKILLADTKYAFSDKNGHYNALKVLDETGVLDYILPELASGRGMEQRKDFHKYDVLEHSLKCVMYADKEVRLAALLHDAGKPFCMKNYGKYYGHDSEGKKIASAILKRLKADKKTCSEVTFLVGAHMADINLDMKENKVRRFIVKNYPYIEKLLKLKQADYAASKDKRDISPCVCRWRKIIEKMNAEGVPKNLKELKITAYDLTDIGFCGKEIGEELNRLFDYAILNPTKNNTESLYLKATKDFDKLRLNDRKKQ